MEDIILMDPEQTEYDQINVYDPVLEDIQDFDNIDKIEKVEEESIENESKQINQSDSVILGSDDINNLSSVKSISVNYDIDNFTKESLWINNNPNNSFPVSTILLNGYISDYDLIGVVFKRSINDNTLCLFLIPSDDFKNNCNSSNSDIYNFLGCGYHNQSYLTRVIDYNTDSSVNIKSCIVWDTGTYVTNNSCCIPLEIFGYKALTLSNNDIPVNPSLSGNNIYYNYNIYCGSLSDDSLSNNLLNKPLNNYSVSESILLFIFMGLFVAGFSWFIKKNIFKL